MSRPIYITNMNLSCGSDLKWSPEQLSVVVHKYGAHKFCSLAWLKKYFDGIVDCVVGVILVCVVVQFYPWFLLYFPLFQTYYHTLQYPKTKEIKFEPRIKFNHNICKLLSNRKRGNEEIQFLCDLGVLHLIGKVHRGSNTDLVVRRFFPFSQGETFDCPERVPFRLTHNIVNAMVSDSRKNDILKKDTNKRTKYGKWGLGFLILKTAVVLLTEIYFSSSYFFPLVGSSWIRGSFSSLLRSYLASSEKSVRFFAHVSSKIFCNTTQAFRPSVCWSKSWVITLANQACCE